MRAVERTHEAVYGLRSQKPRLWIDATRFALCAAIGVSMLACSSSPGEAAPGLVDSGLTGTPVMVDSGGPGKSTGVPRFDDAGGPPSNTDAAIGHPDSGIIPANLIVNWSFESPTEGTSGWAGWQSTLTRVANASAPNGHYVALVTESTQASGDGYSIGEDPDVIESAVAGSTYTATAYVASASASAGGKTVSLVLREEDSSGNIVQLWPSFTTLIPSFQQLTTSAVVQNTGDTLDLYVYQADPAPGDAFLADAITLVPTGGGASSPARDAGLQSTTGTPTLVQHVSSSNTRGNALSSPYCYYYQLPNPSTAGNAIVVGFTFNGAPSPMITDDGGDNYTVVQNYYDTADQQAVAIGAAFNVAAGARVISLCFSDDPGGSVQPMATEFANIVGVDGPGAGNSGTGTSVTTGSLTPSSPDDLVVQVVTSLSLSQSSFGAGELGSDSGRLLSADLRDGWAAQYGVYGSTAPVAPAMSMGASDTWVSAAVLLKAGQTGGVPSGLRVVHLVHENIAYHTSSGGTGNPFPTPLPLQFPSSGNLLVAMIGGGNGPEIVTSMTDSHENAWRQAGATYTQSDATVQTYFAGSATTSEDLALSSNWSGGPGDYTFFLYDVAGAAPEPLDTTAGSGNYQGNAGSLTTSFTITPSTPTEIVFSEVMWDFNTGSGLQGQLFDTNTFTGESISGPEPVDENNGWGHVITTTTDPVSFTWSVLFPVPVGNWAGMAAAFEAAP